MGGDDYRGLDLRMSHEIDCIRGSYPVNMSAWESPLNATPSACCRAEQATSIWPPLTTKMMKYRETGSPQRTLASLPCHLFRGDEVWLFFQTRSHTGEARPHKPMATGV